MRFSLIQGRAVTAKLKELSELAVIAGGIRFARGVSDWRDKFGFATYDLAAKSMGRVLRDRRNFKADPSAVDRFGKPIRRLSDEAEDIAEGVSP